MVNLKEFKAIVNEYREDYRYTLELSETADELLKILNDDDDKNEDMNKILSALDPSEREYVIAQILREAKDLEDDSRHVTRVFMPTLSVRDREKKFKQMVYTVVKNDK